MGQDFEVIRYDGAGFLAFYGIDVSKYGFNDFGKQNTTFAGLKIKQLENDIKGIIGRTFTKPDYTSFSFAEEVNIFTDRAIKTTIRIPAKQNVYVTKNYCESEGILPRGMKIKINDAKAIFEAQRIFGTSKARLSFKIEIDAEIVL